jgi:hypothetical protein
MSTTRAGRTPTAASAAGLLALLLALSLVGLGAVAVRDLLVALGQLGGEPWLPLLPEALDGLTASAAVAGAGVALGVTGFLVVVAGLLPARRTHVAVAGDDGLWLTPGAVAALAASAADRAEGVVASDVRRAGRRRAVVEIAARRDPERVRDAARQQVARQVGDLVPTVIVVDAKKEQAR